MNEFTICLHCHEQHIVDQQTEALKSLEKKYKVHWNNRITRYPNKYPSYSCMLNHSIVTSPTEYIIFVNPRSVPTAEEAEKMIGHMESGFACSMMFNVGYMMFPKELVRKIGWWDERYVGAGCEDNDWVLRLRLANVAIYESKEGTYDMSWTTPASHRGSMQEWNVCFAHHMTKYKEDKQNRVCVKRLGELDYPQWDNDVGPGRSDISDGWGTWEDSLLKQGPLNHWGVGWCGNSVGLIWDKVESEVPVWRHEK